MNDMSPPKFGQKFGMGQSVRRKEDDALLRGAGRYTMDIHVDGVRHGHVVRSVMPHAKITLENVDEVRAMEGVELVLTHDDIAQYGAIPCDAPLGEDADGNAYEQPARKLLADGVVRYVGDPIAFVVADTLEHAAAAGEALYVDYDTLPAVVGVENAMKDDAPQIWSHLAPNNFASEHRVGKRTETEQAFANAAHVVELRIQQNRLVCNYMETRNCLAEYSEEDGFRMTYGTQGVHGQRRTLCKKILGISEEEMHLFTHDVGGGFGPKGFMYHEYPLCAIAAREIGKPVKWDSSRTEHFLADVHGRDNVTYAKLALDEDYKFLGLEVEVLADMGAFLSTYAAYIQWFGASMASGVYDIPAFHVHVKNIFTNTVPTDAYRGAGRPEAAYLIERLVDVAARELGIDAVELRCRNFIKPKNFPYTTSAGRTYDVGEFEAHLRNAMEVADWAGFASRYEQSAANGKVRGIGLATYIEACAFAGSEPAQMQLNEDGTVTIFIGTQANGQGHQTAYAQFAAAVLNMDVNQINVRQGSTEELSKGGGTGGSRSIPLGGVSVNRASAELSEKIKAIASEELEVAAVDLELEGGNVTVVGTDRSLNFAQIAQAAKSIEDVSSVGLFKQTEATYPNGTHICELEIDEETGVVEIVNYVIVDDFGVTVNPLLLAGQVHGGVVQGIGQALYENTVFDESGQLLSASFMDYTMPRADTSPAIQFETRNVPSTTNEMGIKGAGEAGSIGSCPAVMNAVMNAVQSKRDVRHIDMPALPEKLWRALQ